jgi:hypothetical protein
MQPVPSLRKKDGDAPADPRSAMVAIADSVRVPRLVRAARLFPPDRILYFEGTVADDLVQLLDRHAIAPQFELPRGTLWPNELKVHVPAAALDLEVLADVMEHYADPEICSHFAIYRGSTLLLTAYDAGFDVVEVDPDLGSELVAALRAELEPPA